MILLLLGTAQAASLSGTVWASPEGTPLADIAVYAYDQRLNGMGDAVDSHGVFRIDDLPAGRWRIRAVPEDQVDRVSRFLPDLRDFCESEPVVVGEEDEVEGLDLSLPVGAHLAGSLVDQEGEPVVDARVIVAGLSGEVSGLQRESQTDATGRFNAVGLDAPETGAGEWLVYVVADGWPDQFLGPTYEQDEALQFDVESQQAVEAGTHDLLDGISVLGAVEGPDGPVEGADVMVYSGGQVLTVHTDADGAYEAIGLPPGQVIPWTTSSGLAMTYYPDYDRPTVAIEDPGEGGLIEGADLFPPAEAVFQARLVDAATGLPLGGATGLLYNDTHTVGRGNRADEDGLLRIDQLHGGAYELYLWSSDEGGTDGWVLDEDGSNRRFELEAELENPVVEVQIPPSAALSGRLVDEKGDPVYGAVVVAVDRGGSSTTTSSERDGSWSIVGLGADRYTLYALYEAYCDPDPGYVSAWWPGTVNPDWGRPIDLAAGDALTDLDLVLPVDADHDGMGDEWERQVGLDPDRDDAAEDPDGDEYTNLTEYQLGTDPLEGPTGGCRSQGAGLLLLLPLLRRRRRRA